MQTVKVAARSESAARRKREEAEFETARTTAKKAHHQKSRLGIKEALAVMFVRLGEQRNNPEVEVSGGGVKG